MIIKPAIIKTIPIILRVAKFTLALNVSYKKVDCSFLICIAQNHFYDKN